MREARYEKRKIHKHNKDRHSLLEPDRQKLAAFLILVKNIVISFFAIYNLGLYDKYLTLPLRLYINIIIII